MSSENILLKFNDTQTEKKVLVFSTSIQNEDDVKFIKDILDNLEGIGLCTGQMIKFELIKHHPDILKKFFLGAKDRKYQFWERNSMTKYLLSRSMIQQKLEYIHNNPMHGKWMLANNPLA